MKADPLPDGPREYPQLLRGGRHRWWKPLLSIPMFIGVFFCGFFLITLLPYPIGMVIGVRDLDAFADQISSDDLTNPMAFLFGNLVLILLIPVALLTVKVVYRVPVRYLLSVEGRIRWRWLGRCLLVVVPLWVVYLSIGMITDPLPEGRPQHAVALTVIVVLTVPLQAAGEEFGFRCFLGQTLGSWFRRPLLAAVVPMPLSAGLFAWAHGSLDPWTLLDLGSFALAASVLLWRTGGVEASIVLHAVNNVMLMLLTINVGGFADGFVDTDTTGDPLTTVVSVGVHALVTVLLLWQAKRAGVQRIYQPKVGP